MFDNGRINNEIVRSTLHSNKCKVCKIMEVPYVIISNFIKDLYGYLESYSEHLRYCPLITDYY